jgi:UDP-glucose 4-epimerase
MSRIKALGKQVAVLGGCGFIGSHICRELVSRGYAVTMFVRRGGSRARIKDIEDKLNICEGDIVCPDDVLNAIASSRQLIHLAHTTTPVLSMEDPAYDCTSNLVASLRWLSRLSETDVSRILYVSSGGTVYGHPQACPIDENHPTNPISSYGITKLTLEKYVAMYAIQQEIEHCLLRPSNIYGKGQKLHTGQGVVGILSYRALAAEPIEIWGTGQAVRDYLYIDDMVSATLDLLEYTGEQKVFNISSGTGYSVLDVIRVLYSLLGSAPKIVYKPRRPWDVPANVLDSSRLQAETGWYPKVDLVEGIRQTLDWLRPGLRMARVKSLRKTALSHESLLDVHVESDAWKHDQSGVPPSVSGAGRKKSTD